jgi:hypothetical protein
MKKRALILGIAIIGFSMLISFNYYLEDSTKDPLVGTWKYCRHFENNIEIDLDKCEKEDTYIFLEDGTFKETYYYMDESNNCKVDRKNTGSWGHQKDNVYFIDYEGEKFETTLKKDTLIVSYEEGITKKEMYVRE